ncbi:MAG: DUF3310 domain-containing protein [Cyanobacteria bacterium REEB65]|nr:DUF3310 domain-containing protein [Cyanobacteria bacterium REEB65]
MRAPKPQDQPTGETHYSRHAIQPIEFIEENSIPFHEANVIKYTVRWRDKGGIDDLKKARWYLDRLIELNEPRFEALIDPDASLAECDFCRQRRPMEASHFCSGKNAFVRFVTINRPGLVGSLDATVEHHWMVVGENGAYSR